MTTADGWGIAAIAMIWGAIGFVAGAFIWRQIKKIRGRSIRVKLWPEATLRKRWRIEAYDKSGTLLNFYFGTKSKAKDFVRYTNVDDYVSIFLTDQKRERARDLK